MKILLKVHGVQEELEWEVHPEFEVLSLKALIEDSINIAIDEQKILFKGRVLKDEDTLEAAGVYEANGVAPRLYVAQHSGVSAADNVDASSFVPQPGQPPPDTMPPGLQQMLNSPIMSAMLDNPEVLRSMMQANPQMREVMENNPELAHVLNDPEVLRQSLQTSRNPQLMREMMRNTDRALVRAPHRVFPCVPPPPACHVAAPDPCALIPCALMGAHAPSSFRTCVRSPQSSVPGCVSVRAVRGGGAE